MKTVQLTVYKFNELPENIQSKLIEKYRDGQSFDDMYGEAQQTVEKFCELSGVESVYKSWLEFRVPNFDGNVLILTGLRLRTWLINNWGGWLYKRKQFSLWSKTEKSFKHYKEGYPKLKIRRSKVLTDKSCVLTGVCYDDDLLEVFYNFIDDYKNFSEYPKGANDAENICLEDLLQRAFDQLKCSLEDEQLARFDSGYIADELSGQELDYDINGNEINY